MCQPAAPTPPSVAETAAAQTTSNKETAIAQANLNAVNQVTPDGSLTYSVNGTNADGTPIRTATTSLSPTGQALLDTNNVTKQNVANVARDSSARLGGLLDAPIDFSAQKDYLTSLTSGALDKTWARDEATLASTLANKGIAEGSDAYTRAFSDFRNDKSAAYNSANASNFTTAQQSQLALRNQPINEILALAGQTQVGQPSLVSTPQTAVAGTDIAGLTTNNYNQQMASYNASNANNSSMLGGLFGAAGKIGAAAYTVSDERAKTDIEYDGGMTEDGIPTADFRYAWEPEGTSRHGVIAQDVARIRPDAVGRIGGLLLVDHTKIPEAEAA